MALTTLTRLLVRSRLFSLTVVLTLGLGVGALIIAFGVVNAALFRQPPFARFELLAQQQRSFEQLASYSPGSVTLSGNGEADLVQVERVSGSYFPLLRATAVRGRRAGLTPKHA